MSEERGPDALVAPPHGIGADILVLLSPGYWFWRGTGSTGRVLEKNAGSILDTAVTIFFFKSERERAPNARAAASDGVGAEVLVLLDPNSARYWYLPGIYWQYTGKVLMACT